MFKYQNYTIVWFLFPALFFITCDFSSETKVTPRGLASTMTSEIDQKKMVLIPGGQFIMGTDKKDKENTHRQIGTVKPLYLDQRPQHIVHLEDFYIDRYEVTNLEYKRFLDDTGFYELPSHWEDETFAEGTGNLPVTNVTWYEAFAYSLWAHKRLPTEAQWEKAARGPDGRDFPWGNQFNKDWANIGIDGAKSAMPAKSFPKDVSPYEVYDMAGNVMEWTLNWYQPYTGNSYKSSRFGESFKVIRGSGFQKAGHYFLQAYNYVFYRTEADPDAFYENVGFRTVTPFISGN